MTDDLSTLFADAYRTAPPSTLDADLVVRHGRRVRARRKAVTSAGALLGAGAVVAGSVALVSGTAPGASSPVGGLSSLGGVESPTAGGATTARFPLESPAVPTPVPSGSIDPPSTPTPLGSIPPSGAPRVQPSGLTASGDLEPKPVGIDAVGLADPAPGFPIRRWADHVAPTSGVGPRYPAYYVAAFGLERTPTTAAGIPTGPQITILVGDFPMPTMSAGKLQGDTIVATPQVAGATGYVTSYAEKGTPMHDLYFSSGTFTVEIHGFGGVTTAELVTLGNALTGLR